MPSGSTYTWQNLIDVVNSHVKQSPGFAPMHCNMVYTKVYFTYVWHWTKTNIPTTGEASATVGLIPLVDGVQDYSAPPQIYRLLSAKINRTDVSPRQVQEIDVRESLSIDLSPRSYRNIQCCALQSSVGLLRLEAAVQVPAGVTLELGGEYQLEPDTVQAFSEPTRIPDKYASVLMAGLLYWGYLLTDDPRAGTVSTDAEGRETGTGQYGTFLESIRWMQRAEDLGAEPMVYPSEPLGVGRDPGGLNIFGNPS